MVRWPLILASVSLFIGSLFVTGLVFEPVSQGTTWPGWALLLLGWLGIIGFCPAWFANPLYLIGLFVLALGKPARKMAQWLLLAALIVGTSVITMVVFGVPSDVSGDSSHWTHARLKSGFYLWITALSVAALAAWLPAKEEASEMAKPVALPDQDGLGAV